MSVVAADVDGTEAALAELSAASGWHMFVDDLTGGLYMRSDDQAICWWPEGKWPTIMQAAMAGAVLRVNLDDEGGLLLTLDDNERRAATTYYPGGYGDDYDLLLGAVISAGGPHCRPFRSLAVEPTAIRRARARLSQPEASADDHWARQAEGDEMLAQAVEKLVSAALEYAGSEEHREVEMDARQWLLDAPEMDMTAQHRARIRAELENFKTTMDGAAVGDHLARREHSALNGLATLWEMEMISQADKSTRENWRAARMEEPGMSSPARELGPPPIQHNPEARRTAPDSAPAIGVAAVAESLLSSARESAAHYANVEMNLMDAVKLQCLGLGDRIDEEDGERIVQEARDAHAEMVEAFRTADPEAVSLVLQFMAALESGHKKALSECRAVALSRGI